MVKADDIFLFVNVVDEGSFSAVVEKLEMTNSVVSKRISRLEKDLNVQLLYRTTRKLSLTDAGRTRYGKARLAKETLNDAQTSVTGYGEAIQGRIKITAPAVSASLVLSEAIADFAQTYPDISIELSVDNKFVDLIEQGYDLAIRTAHQEDSSLIVRRLIDSHWMVCASPAYLKSHGTPDSPDALQKHNCLIYKYEGSGPDLWQFQENGIDYNVQVQGRFQTNNLDTLKQAALASFGIACLPKALIYESLFAGTLEALLTNYTNKDLGIYAVYPKARQPDKKLGLIVEHFRQAFLAKSTYFS